MYLRGKSICLWRDWSSDRSFIVDPLSYFSFQPVLHNKGRDYVLSYLWNGAYKITLAANLSLSEWSCTICPKPYNRK